MVMAKFTVDTANKLFIAKAGVTTFDVKVDLYSDAKEHWIADNDANKFTFPFVSSTTGRTTTVGGQDIDAGAGTSIPTYVFLENGWRVRPDEADHTLGVTGGVLLVQGGGDPFADTLGAFTVRVNYQQPVQAIGTSGTIAPSQQQLRDSMKLAPSGGAPAADSVDDYLGTLVSSDVMISTTVAVGSTDSSIRTPLTQADGYWNGHIVTVVLAGGPVARRIDHFNNTNGEIIFLEDLPDTPSVDDQVFIRSDHSPYLGSFA